MGNISKVSRVSRRGRGDSLAQQREVVFDSRHAFIRQLIRANRGHSWTNATVGIVGRTMTGIDWHLVKDDEFSDQATEEGKAKILSFLNSGFADFSNIKDFIGVRSRFSQTVMLFKLIGQAGWEVIYKNGEPVGFDVISGYVIPNVDEDGNFRTPAFLCLPWSEKSASDFTVYNQDEVVYFFDPGVSGSITGETAYEALASTAIPADLNASTSYRELFGNVNAPYNGFWVVDPGVADEDYDAFLDLLEERYVGPENFGRNPLVIRGDVRFEQIKSRSEEDAPYLEGRRYSQTEISAVTGVYGNQLGITESSNKANIRETRRGFHENVMRPLISWLEDEIYRQVFVRILGISGWRLVFDRPDFMNALEQATIDNRYVQIGALNPNEVRASLGYPPREGGDDYLVMPGMSTGDDKEESNPDDDTGSTDIPPPERVPRDEESDKENALSELFVWRKLHLRSMNGKRERKEFEVRHIPKSIGENVGVLLSMAGDDFGFVKRVFASARDAIEQHYDSLENSNEAD